MVTLIEKAKSFLECGRLSPAAVQSLGDEANIEELMLGLFPLACSFAAPVLSGFSVGAIAQGESGALYFGGNYEFSGSALTQTIHAEQAAVVNAEAHREQGIVRLAVSSPPCGCCRQFLYELATASKLKIILPQGPYQDLEEALPGAFGPGDLGVQAGLLASEPHDLKKSQCVAGPGVEEAVASACRSYAPYTSVFGGAAVVTRDGNVFSSPYLENAAYNPSVSPMQGALIIARLNGYSDTEIESAVVAQIPSAKVDHFAAARLITRREGTGLPIEEVMLEYS
ncbi:MAG: cytidine deaminase [Verrucomicrobiales bacterium]|nr:cytidine deaminase [Verrucomicrobiales bacterium]